MSKLPPGVEVRGQTIRISFTVDGVRCREPMPQLKLTDKNIQYAANYVANIKAQIKIGSFDYLREFPNSPRALKVSTGIEADLKRTISQGINSYLELYKLNRHKSGFKAVKSKSKHILNYFGDSRQIRTVKKNEIEKFKFHLIHPTAGYKLSPKTANEVLGILIKVFEDAFDDLIITTNLAKRVSKFKTKKVNASNADPFTKNEIYALEQLDYERPQDKHMFLFGIWTGLSVAELRALAWEDINLELGIMSVKRAEVEGQYKCTKELVRERTIELLEPALFWLHQQKNYSINIQASEITVIQDDSITTIEETITFVFYNDQSRQNKQTPIPFRQKPMETRFHNILKRANIKLRSPNQCRHTFASQMVSQYIPLEWVARQLGHADTTMVKKHYGRWIPQDTKSMAKIVEEMVGVKGKYLK
ncbi:Arm DNA-binding domain-containing protein [Colwellia sp. MEBiC06753]